MKRLAAALIVAGIGLFAVTPALAAPSNPHQEEQDGCDHGHTGKKCKPDPQPNHGKDCVKHGKHGGINEDHCSTTTTGPTTTTTTVPDVTTTTVPGVTTTTVPEGTSVTTGPSVQNPVPETSVEGTVLEKSVVTAAPVAGELATTGSWSLYMALLGAAAGLTGLGLMLFASAMKRVKSN